MDEHWDVTDADGMPTGRTHRRDDADWPAGAFHVVAASCVLRRDARVLLTRRAAGKEFPLAWEFPGGSALAGETSAEAASRELREETGLTVPPVALRRVGRFTEASALLDLYVVRAPDAANVVIDRSEVSAYAWVPLGEVARRLRAGELAEPWTARLEALWGPLERTIATL